MSRARFPAAMGAGARQAALPARLGTIIWLLLPAMLSAAALAAAAEVVVLSAGAMEPAVAPLLLEFGRASGHRPTVEFGTAPELAERLSGKQPGDVLIAPSAVMDRAVAGGQVRGTTRVSIGRIGVGVFVRRSARVPAVSTPDDLRQALLEAATIVYTRGSSGQYVDTLLSRLGIEPKIRAKIVRTADADAALARVADGGDGDLGFGAITAIKAHNGRGTQLVAPLPDSLQKFTTYEAAVRTTSSAPAAAAELLQFLLAPAARAQLRNVGVQ